jgi:SM-20-related protein
MPWHGKSRKKGEPAGSSGWTVDFVLSFGGIDAISTRANASWHPSMPKPPLASTRPPFPDVLNLPEKHPDPGPLAFRPLPVDDGGSTSFPDERSMSLLADAVAEPGYGVFPDFLPTGLQDDLRALMEEKMTEDRLVRAGVGTGSGLQVRPEIRTDFIVWLDEQDPAPVVQAWLGAMTSLCEYFRHRLFLPLWSYEGHLARYPAAGFYKPHLDQHLQTMARQITVIAYLNELWEDGHGGELRLFTDPQRGVKGPYLEVLPRAGTLVIFRSADFWHEVRPSTRERISLTGWLRGREEWPLQI